MRGEPESVTRARQLWIEAEQDYLDECNKFDDRNFGSWGVDGSRSELKRLGRICDIRQHAYHAAYNAWQMTLAPDAHLEAQHDEHYEQDW